MDRRLDRLYRRYCARGELAALARLFDLAAPELLAVAKHLCGDEAEAEDAVQATFVTLIEKRADFDGSRRFAPWALGILAKHAHAMRRRAERELDPRRFDAREADEPQVEIAGAELRARLSERIDALPATYASVLRAHLLEGAGPREIGERLAISPNAASVRVHRGLRLLRKVLPPGIAFGALAARPARGLAAVRAELVRHASLASASVVPSTAAGITAAALSGGIVMKKLVVLGVALVVSVVGWRVANRTAAAPATAVEGVALEPIEGTQNPASVSEPSVVAERESPGVPSAGERSPLAPAATPAVGDLVVHLTWQRTGRPAEGIEVLLIGPGHGSSEATSDGRGDARFEGLPPGRAHVRLDRSRAQGMAEVRAGEESRFGLELPRALEVSGIVVDFRGEPVAGASVLLAGPAYITSGRTVATSGPDGRFELPDLDPGCRLGARMRGYAPSALRCLGDIGSNESEALDRSLEVKLVLPARGGSLAGRVVDAGGRPVAGATLDVGGFQQGIDAESESFSEPIERATDGSLSTPARPLVLRTDAAGAFACEGVELGRVPVRVRTPNDELAGWNGIVLVREDERAWLEVRLTPGAAIEGRVTNADGGALAGIDVDVWGEDPSLRRVGRTNADGRYRVERIPPGRVEVHANKGRAKGVASAKTELELEDGALAEWNAVLPSGLAIAGRLVDEGGEPLAGWRLLARLSDSRSLAGRAAYTDAEGRFRVDGCEDAAYRLELRPKDDGDLAPPRAWRDEVRPGGEELELVADTTSGARIVGRVVDARGEPIPDARLWATLKPVSRYVSAETDASGDVAIEGLPAGVYLLTVISPRYPYEQLGERELAPERTLDLGEIALADPGRIELTVRDANGAPPEGLTAELWNVEDRQTSVPMAVESPGLARSGPAPAGSYAIVLRAPGCAAQRVEVTLAPGEERALDVTLAKGRDCAFAFEAPGGGEALRWTRVEFLDADGALVLRANAYDPSGSGEVRLTERLAPGRYVLRASSSRPERSGELAFEVLDLAGEERFLVTMSE